MAVSLPPTWARNSTVSTAANWPRKTVVPPTVACSGWLTVTCGGAGGGVAGDPSLCHARWPAIAASATSATPATQASRPLPRRGDGDRWGIGGARPVVSGADGDRAGYVLPTGEGSCRNIPHRRQTLEHAGQGSVGLQASPVP